MQTLVVLQETCASFCSLTMKCLWTSLTRLYQPQGSTNTYFIHFESVKRFHNIEIYEKHREAFYPVR